MVLLLQLNGDLPSHFPDDERRLHIFSCRRKACARQPGSIRALREVRKHRSTRQAPVGSEEEKAGLGHAQEKVPREDLGAALFSTAPAPSSSTHTNPFSLPNTALSVSNNANPFAGASPTSTLAAKPPQATIDTPEPPSETFASKLKLSSTAAEQNSTSALPAAQPWPSTSLFPPPYPHLYLDADYETLVPDQPTQGSSTTVSTSNPQYDIDDTASHSNVPTEKD